MYILCQINDESHIKELENIKYNKTKLVVFYFELFNLLNQCKKTDSPDVQDSWSGEYSYSFRDNYDAAKTSICLVDCLDY